MADEEEKEISSGVLVLLSLLIVTLVIAQLLKGLPFIQLSGIATLVGALAGLALQDATSSYLELPALSADFLFVFLIPPIIFESGYNMNKVLFTQKHFFNQIGTILLFAFVGTLLSGLLVGSATYLASEFGAIHSLSFVECFVFGALISATDTVSVLAIMKSAQADTVLYNIIFGESVLNDAVAIVLYQTIVKIHTDNTSSEIAAESILIFFWTFLGSACVGALISAVVSIILKMVFIESRSLLETCCVLFGPWIAYLISEISDLSGIVSVLVCGMLMARYTAPNLSGDSKVLVRRMYKSITSAAEILVFLFLGLGLFGFELDFGGVGLQTYLLCPVIIFGGRGLVVLLCANITNPLRSTKISFRAQLFIWFAGFRGAIAFALAIKARDEFDNGEVILTITIVYALFSVLGGGVLIMWLLKTLKLTSRIKEIAHSDNAPPVGCCATFKTLLSDLERRWLYSCLVRDSALQSDTEEENKKLPELSFHSDIQD